MNLAEVLWTPRVLPPLISINGASSWLTASGNGFAGLRLAERSPIIDRRCRKVAPCSAEIPGRICSPWFTELRRFISRSSQVPVLGKSHIDSTRDRLIFSLILFSFKYNLDLIWIMLACMLWWLQSTGEEHQITSGVWIPAGYNPAMIWICRNRQLDQLITRDKNFP